MKKQTILFQDNELTRAKYDFSPLEKNVMYMLMSQLSSNDPSSKYYYISVNEMQEKTGVYSRYSDYETATDRLMSKKIVIKKVNGNVLRVNLVSSAEYIKGSGIIELGVDPKLRPYLFDLKENFTTFQLELALSLKSKYSKRIYEKLSQFKDTGYMSITINDLKIELGLINEKTGIEQYKMWSAFEARVLKVAHKEINNFTDLRFNYESRKRGKKYHSVEFHIEKVGYQTLIDFKDEDTVLFGRLVNKFRLRRDQAQEVLTKYNSPKGKIELNKLLYPVMVKISNNEIKNIGGYVASLLNV